jgi:hypothetical protein
VRKKERERERKREKERNAFVCCQVFPHEHVLPLA